MQFHVHHVLKTVNQKQCCAAQEASTIMSNFVVEHLGNYSTLTWCSAWSNINNMCTICCYCCINAYTITSHTTHKRHTDLFTTKPTVSSNTAWSQCQCFVSVACNLRNEVLHSSAVCSLIRSLSLKVAYLMVTFSLSPFATCMQRRGACTSVRYWSNCIVHHQLHQYDYWLPACATRWRMQHQ